MLELWIVLLKFVIPHLIIRKMFVPLLQRTLQIYSRMEKNQLIDYLTENVEYFTTNIEVVR